jgi:glycosyltransferase involved in cell wall biosynthesis
MTEDWPFVSIIVPVYNGSRSIDALLTSLLALDYPADRCEILIVDNKSTDDTCERVQRYPVTLLEETEIQSSYAARNRGIRAAKGGIIAFTDADCVADPDWLGNLLADHQDHHWAGFAGGFEAYPPRTDVQRHMANTDASCFTPEFMHQPFLAPQSKGELICSRLRFLDYRADIPLPLNLLNPPTANVAYRRQIFDQIGYFDARLTSGDDLDFAWRVQMRTERQIKLVPEAIIYHRHRRDLPSMARQYRKNGWGYGLQALHQASEYGSDPYRIARQMQIESLILISLSIPRHFLDFSSRLLRALFHRPIDPLYVKTPVYTLVGTVNFYCGRLTAARNGNKALFQESPYGLPARPPGKPP